MRKSSLKHIREDIGVKEIIICGESLRKHVTGKIKEPDEVQVAQRSYICRSREFPNKCFAMPKIAPTFGIILVKQICNFSKMLKNTKFT